MAIAKWAAFFKIYPGLIIFIPVHTQCIKQGCPTAKIFYKKITGVCMQYFLSPFSILFPFVYS